MTGEIRIKNETVAQLSNYLISRGIPLPPGKVTEPAQVSITTSDGSAVPSAGRVLQRRQDGSIEWLLMDIITDLDGEEKKSLFIKTEQSTHSETEHQVTVEKLTDEIRLSNGLTTLILPEKEGSLISFLEINHKILINKNGYADLQVTGPGSKIYRAGLMKRERVTVVHHNPLHATVRIEGKHWARDNSSFLDFALEFSLGAGCPDLKIDHTFYCRENLDGIIKVNGIKLIMQTTMDPASRKIIRQAHHGRDYFPREMEIAENAEIVASSEADIDNYRQYYKPYTQGHPSAGGTVFLRNLDSLKEDFSQYPFHMRPGQGSGFRAEHSIGGMRRIFPFIGWRESNFTFITTFERLKQLHPKSIAIDENEITYAIWPEWSIPMEIVQGVSKTHTIWLTGIDQSLNIDQIEHHALRWEVTGLDPVDISFDPTWPAYCEVFDCQHLLKFQPEKYPLLENLIEPYPAAGNPNRFTYDRHSPSGMFNYGDTGGPSWTNNEDDRRVFVPLQDYLRTGRTYAFDCGKEAARHYMEVDFCEWNSDPLQRGGFIPHTNQHFVGCVYPSHQWAEGILAYYYLTGDERARKAVIACGDNCCYWAENRIETICCDGREAGMPLVNLAAAYRLTRNDKYIEAAQIIIKNFHQKYYDIYGDLCYPYPQGAHLKIIKGYGDWSSFAGLYRIWEHTQDEKIKKLLLAFLENFVHPENFNLNDARVMDFYAAWIYIILTGKRQETLKKLQSVIPMLLRRGGHAMRRLHFLKILDEEGLIDEQLVGNRAGAI